MGTEETDLRSKEIKSAGFREGSNSKGKEKKKIKDDPPLSDMDNYLSHRPSNKIRLQEEGRVDVMEVRSSEDMTSARCL